MASKNGPKMILGSFDQQSQVKGHTMMMHTYTP